MLEVTKAIINNLNEIPYLKNKYRMKPVKNVVDSYNNTAKNMEKDELAQLESLEGPIRHNNLKVYGVNILKARVKQFTIITVPAILVATDLFLWCVPGSKTQNKSLDTYKKTTMVFDEDEMLYAGEDDKTYYSSFINYDFVDEKAANISNTSTTLYFQIREDLDSLFANFTIANDGIISLVDVSFEKYIDLNKYGF